MDKPTLKPEGDWAEIIAALEEQMAAPIRVIDAKTGKEPFWASRIGKPLKRKPKPPIDPNAPKKKRGRKPKPTAV